MRELISLDDARRPLPAESIESRGGFAWWYAEILDEQANGVVLIWSFGLPFLPGYRSSARRGQADVAGQRPSLNIAVYESGKPEFYVLHEFDSDEVSWDGDGVWRFGDTVIRRRDEAGTRYIEAHIDCPLGDSNDRVVGRLRVGGPIPALAEDDLVPTGESQHLWTPLIAPAFGTASIRTMADEFRFSIAGRAYHDRNASSEPLDELGIHTWLWGHASMVDGERIFYALWPEEDEEPRVLGYDIDRRGQIRQISDLEVEMARPEKTTYGMPSWEWLQLHRDGTPWVRVTMAKRVDDGPFYLRYLTEVTEPLAANEDEPEDPIEAAEATDETAGDHPRCIGSAEVIVPSRVDLDRHRFLVRMRVSSDQRPNSMWLPLFQGHRKSRVSRLLRRWVRGAGRRWIRADA